MDVKGKVLLQPVAYAEISKGGAKTKKNWKSTRGFWFT